MAAKSALRASYYDRNIEKTIPYYRAIQDETLKLVKVLKSRPSLWLDTGCGTGSFALKAARSFPDTKFILSDPSLDMLEIAERKLGHMHFKKSPFRFINSRTEDLGRDIGQKPDVITAFFCHHYLSGIKKIEALRNCRKLLDRNGIFVSFENSRPFSKQGVKNTLLYWERFQLDRGKSRIRVKQHLDRFNKEYFPLTPVEQVDMLKSAGFGKIEIFWHSYMQTGFYCTK